MKLFYFCFIESLVTFFFLSWFGGLSIQNLAKLNRIIRHSEKVVGDELNALSITYEKRAVRKGRKFSSDTSHFLSQHFIKLPSGRRFAAPLVRTERFKRSYIPTAIRLLNNAPQVSNPN